jgi:hypothetical protein
MNGACLPLRTAAARLFGAAKQPFTGDAPVADFLAFQHHEEFVAAGVLANSNVLANAFKSLFQAWQVVSQMADPAAKLEQGSIADNVS